MDDTEAPNWTKDFENKDKSEILAMPLPEGLSNEAFDGWWLARERAIEALEDAEEDAVPVSDEPLSASRKERTRVLLDEMHDAQLRAREREQVAQKPLLLPQGDAAQLLERQLASSAALIGYLSEYVARNDTNPDVCMSFMAQMTSMLGASANVGKVVGRLRGIVSQSRQTFAYENEGGRARGRG